jgi:hypothetical protein
MTNFVSKPFRTVFANDTDAYIPELWAQESVAILMENMVIANLVHTDFSNEVAKFGDIVHTRKPAEFTAARKTNADSVTIQDASATDIEVKLDQHFHTSFTIKDGEESKSFKQLTVEYLEPAVKSIAKAIDQILLGQAHSFYLNQEGLRNGLTTGNIIAEIVDTRKRMNINKAHVEGRNMILTPDSEAVALQVSTFHDADKVGDEGTALREASLGKKFQFEMFMCQNASSTIGVAINANTPEVDLTAGYPIGTTVVHVDVAGSSLKVGHWISIGGVLHQVTALGTLTTQDIDVTIAPGLRSAVIDGADVTIGGECLVNDTGNYAAGYGKELVIDGYTGIIPAGTLCSFADPGTPNTIRTGIYSIISTTETAGDTTGITLNRPLEVIAENNDEIHLGPPAQHNFAFHRNALALISRPLAPAPAGLALSSIADANGVGVRVTITYNGNTQGVLVTVDVLCGVKVLDTDLGAVMIG